MGFSALITAASFAFKAVGFIQQQQQAADQARAQREQAELNAQDCTA